jgi:hypothetical protein
MSKRSISERLYNFFFHVLVFVGALVTFIFFYMLLLELFTEPRNDREWREDLSVLPAADVMGEQVRIHNVRNFWWHSPDEYEPAYYDADYDLSELNTMYFAVTPFSSFSGAAHTFLTFQFDTPPSDESLGPRFLSVSVEARKEVGENYTPIAGLFNQYELMYVLADERDMVTLRTHVYGDDVYLYPVAMPVEEVRKTFLSIMEEVNHLYDEPAFYHTFAKNCTTELVRHVNRASPGLIPFSVRYVLPGYADTLVYDLGLMDTDLSFTAAEEVFKVTDLSGPCLESADYSLCIRSGFDGAPAD